MPQGGYPIPPAELVVGPFGGELIGKTYETHKRLISFRANISTREMSEEQKEAASERFKQMWKDRQENKESEETEI